MADEEIANQVYAWNNQIHGIAATSGTVRRPQFRKVHLNNNNQNANGRNNLNISNTCENGVISLLVSYGGQGVSVSGTVSTALIFHADVVGTFDPTQWGEIGGDKWQQFPIPDDDVVTFTASYSEQVDIHTDSGNAGMYLKEFNSVSTIATVGSVANQGLIDLTRTAGTDGNLNISRDGNVVHIKNRTGSSITAGLRT